MAFFKLSMFLNLITIIFLLVVVCRGYKDSRPGLSKAKGGGLAITLPQGRITYRKIEPEVVDTFIEKLRADFPQVTFEKLEDGVLIKWPGGETVLPFS